MSTSRNHSENREAREAREWREWRGGHAAADYAGAVATCAAET